MPDPIIHFIIGLAIGTLLMRSIKGFGRGRMFLFATSCLLLDIDNLLVMYGVTSYNYHFLHNIGGIFIVSILFSVLYAIAQPHILSIPKLTKGRVFATVIAGSVLHLVSDLITYDAEVVAGIIGIGYQPFLPLSDWTFNYHQLMVEYYVIGGWAVPLSALVILGISIGSLWFLKHIKKRVV